MRISLAKSLRYLISLLLLMLGVLGQIGALITGHAILNALYPPTPDVKLGGVVAVVATPSFGALFVVLSLLTLGLGVSRYGSLASFLLATTTFVDDLLTLSLFDEPLVEGRVRHGDISWRLQYWDGDRIEALYQECPRCGVELDEGYVPRHELHEPNVAFDPGETVERTETAAWTDVYGEQTVDDRDETLALVCPQCQSSMVGSKDTDGRAAARSKFRHHIQQMKLSNPRDDPFASYSSRIRDTLGAEPTPVTVWDQYVETTDSDEILRVSVRSPEESGDGSSGTETGGR